jgi:hypothetical protein
MDTYVTLSCLLTIALVCAIYVVVSFYKKEKKNFHTYDFPLDNKNKWWYN